MSSRRQAVGGRRRITRDELPPASRLSAFSPSAYYPAPYALAASSRFSSAASSVQSPFGSRSPNDS
jgi:hypothetical protein